MEENRNMCCQALSPPLKKQKLEEEEVEEEAVEEEEEEEEIEQWRLLLNEKEEEWFHRINTIRERHYHQAVLENAMNSLIEQTGLLRRRTVEDEAVAMAIRSHGLACATQTFESLLESGDHPIPIPLSLTLDHDDDPFEATTSTDPSEHVNDDILSHALTAAIKKKGLGAVDR